MATNELDNWCYNCDTAAIVFVNWKNSRGEDEHSSMCQTCADAFEFGQSIPNELVEEIVHSQEEEGD